MSGLQYVYISIPTRTSTSQLTLEVTLDAPVRVPYAQFVGHVKKSSGNLLSHHLYPGEEVNSGITLAWEITARDNNATSCPIPHLQSTK